MEQNKQYDAGPGLAIRSYAESILDAIRQPVLILDDDLRVDSASRAFYNTFQVQPREVLGRCVYELGNEQWDMPQLRDLLNKVLRGDPDKTGVEVQQEFPGIGRRSVMFDADRIVRAGKGAEYILLGIEDRTVQFDLAERLRAAHEQLEQDYSAITAAYDRERRITQALQRPLLLPTPENAFPGLAVATVYAPAWSEADIGGDFSDMFALPDGRIAFAVGDITGKGPVAAARSIETRDMLRAVMRVYPHYPGSTLARLNDHINEIQRLDGTFDMFMSLAIALIDVKVGTVSLSWAGIDAPVIRRQGGRIIVVRGGAPPLGAVEDERFEETTVPFADGDLLMLATDGLSEARKGQEFLEQAGLVDLLERAMPLPTMNEIAESMLNGARNFAGGLLLDDACLVLVRRVAA